jgi:hypothetical protein
MMNLSQMIPGVPRTYSSLSGNLIDKAEPVPIPENKRRKRVIFLINIQYHFYHHLNS